MGALKLHVLHLGNRVQDLVEDADGGGVHDQGAPDEVAEPRYLGSPIGLLLSLQTYTVPVALENHLSHIIKLTESHRWFATWLCHAAEALM